MSGAQYYSFLLVSAGVLLWQLISGKAAGVWWRPRISRQDDPWAYWFSVTAQAVIWVLALAMGRTWHVR
jgi:hypothetical protein